MTNQTTTTRPADDVVPDGYIAHESVDAIVHAIDLKPGMRVITSQYSLRRDTKWATITSVRTNGKLNSDKGGLTHVGLRYDDGTIGDYCTGAGNTWFVRRASIPRTMTDRAAAVWDAVTSRSRRGLIAAWTWLVSAGRATVKGIRR